MSEEKKYVATQTKTEERSQTGGLLEKTIQATKRTDPDRTKELLKVLTKEALKGTVRWDRNILKTIKNAIESIDKIVSKQVTEIIHHPKFLKLEGSWRGVQYLMKNSDTEENTKVRILDTEKEILQRDLENALDFDQSEFFKLVYEKEFGTPGGEPYSFLLGDFNFDNTPEDIDLLENISHVSAAAFAPFISATTSEMFGFKDWSGLSEVHDLKKMFSMPEYERWRELREESDSRFVYLTMPRTLARSPYNSRMKTVRSFSYQEAALDKSGQELPLDHDHYCWMNTAYVMGSRLTTSFADTGWCLQIRGMENGGKVSRLATHTFKTDEGDVDSKCPTEIAIADRREAELSKLGFLPLCHYKNTNYAVFFGAQSIQEPEKSSDPNSNADSLISSRLPYMMITSRFAHYLKVLVRDKIGSYMNKDDIQKWLSSWVVKYTNANSDSGPKLRAKYPLREARIEVEDVPGQPGSYNAVAWMRPWLQLEELSTSLRLVAKLPGGEEEGDDSEETDEATDDK